jgi:hypothetical protein
MVANIDVYGWHAVDDTKWSEGNIAKSIAAIENRATRFGEFSPTGSLFSMDSFSENYFLGVIFRGS